MEQLKKDILLSFILPVYNVEAYLQECVDSILQQITEECEIILVDDGSTDSSAEICRKYTKEYPQVKAIRKENGGLSSARNAGMSIAGGKYITFVDSDDKIFDGSVKDILLWVHTHEADLCFLQAVKRYPDGTQTELGEGIVRSELYQRSREDAIRHLASRPKYPGSAWAKLYRREFLVSHGMHFPYDRRYSEDLGFLRDCILKANSFDALEIPFYQYRQNRPGSITNKVSSKNFFDLSTFVIESAEMLMPHKKSVDPVSRTMMGFVAYEYSILLYLYDVIPQADREKAFTILKDYRWVLRYAYNRKCRIVSLVQDILGIRMTARIMKQYREIVEQ